MRKLLCLLTTCLLACAAPRAGHGATPASEAASGNETPAAAPVAAALVAIPNAQQPLPGIVTGGQPSEAQLRQAHATGYRTVISLLPDGETATEGTLARELGLRFVSIPVHGAEDLTEAKASELGRALHAEGALPVILHCASGNRAGALLALEQFYVEHASTQEALTIGDRAGLKALRAAVEERLKAPATP